jgi:5-methylthioribose kinase
LLLLSVDTVAQVLQAAGWPGAPEALIRPLGGGVSNAVFLAEGPAGRVVCKQALEKLRVAADWRARPERTLREADAMQALGPLLPPGAVPRIVFIDRPNCIYGMEAAPEPASDWKLALLAGQADPAIAAAAGRTLGAIIRATSDDPSWEARFGDQTVFEELRLDPYYRFTAARHPDCAAALEALITACRTRRVCLVHGDWSPKNLLPCGGSVMAIDFEVVHYGDPCFDTAFLVNHLLLKSIHLPSAAAAFGRCAQAFWESLEVPFPWLWSGTMAHLGGLLLARADGKSPAEYLHGAQLDQVRRLAKYLIHNPQPTIEDVWKCL